MKMSPEERYAKVQEAVEDNLEQIREYVGRARVEAETDPRSALKIYKAAEKFANKRLLGPLQYARKIGIDFDTDPRKLLRSIKAEKSACQGEYDLSKGRYEDAFKNLSRGATQARSKQKKKNYRIRASQAKSYYRISEGLEKRSGEAISDFIDASSAAKSVLTEAEPYQKSRLMSIISLAEALIAVCEAQEEEDELLYEEAFEKLDQAQSILPNVHYSIELLSRALGESEEEKKKLIRRAKKRKGKSATGLEKSVLDFLLKVMS